MTFITCKSNRELKSPAPAVIPPYTLRIAPYVTLTFVIFVAYINIYDNAFLFDDDLLIVMNRYLQSWNTFEKLFTATTTEGAGITGGFFRPIQNILYFFIYQAGGQQPFGFHLLNVTLHIANACLAFTLSRKLGFAPIPSFLAILLWAVHPLHTEAITYMSGTADPLFLLFILIALTWLAPAFRFCKILACLPLFLLALMSKETALIFPALVMITMFLTLPDKKLDPRNYLHTIPLWLMALAYLYWRYTTDYLDGPSRYAKLFQLEGFSSWNLYAQNPLWRIQTFLATLPNYLSLIFWPTNLHIERSFAVYASWKNFSVIAGISMLALSLAQLIWSRGKRDIALSWGLLWFAAAHFPDTGLLIPVNSLFLEHWMYVPTLGLFLGTAETMNKWLESKQWRKIKIALTSCALIASLALCAKTLQQNIVWYNPFIFYNHIFACGETSPRGHNNLALAYKKNFDLPNAIKELRNAVKEGDTYAETHHNLALSLLELPDGTARRDEAIKELQRAIEIEPKFYRSHIMLARLYKEMGKNIESEQELLKAKNIIEQIEHNNDSNAPNSHQATYP